MTWLDYAVLGVLGVSVAWGIWHGLVREVVSLGAWVMAFLAANLFAGPLSEYIPASVVRPEFRILLAFISLFIVVLAVTSLAGMLLSKLLKKVGLGAVDRALGGVFGVARAAVVLLAFALVAGLTALPRDPAWRQSLSGPVLARGAVSIKPWLPPALAERLRYD
jgi:membrane protein required for colicin V production